MSQNVLVIMSDEHNPKVLGCAGHPVIETPHLDALARRGTRFTSAYTTSPICVPARAAFAAGKYTHQIGYWDNADPYDGAIPSWHHCLREAGHEVVSIGKLHFNNAGADHGFSKEIVPMHVLEGKGDLMGLIREDIPKRGGAKKMAGMAGPGESTYTQYDRDICARAEVWLRESVQRSHDKPWVLFVSFVAPHFPLTAPPPYFYKYFNRPDLPMPRLYAADQRPDHPFLKDYRESSNYDDYFENENDVRRALAGYFGLVNFLDDHVGRLMKVLEEVGLTGSTDVIYTSDHGDNLGSRGLWGKSNMYDEVAGVPFIAAGPSFPKGKTISTPVSHVDAFPTILELADCTPSVDLNEYPGVSLTRLASGEKPKRTVLSEYHAMGSTTGAYMIRVGKYKYVHYAQYQPQLFDLEADPYELEDMAGRPEMQELLQQCQAKLYELLDPVEVDRRAKARQLEQLNQHGGREAVIARGDLGYTPTPGSPANFM